MILRNRANQLSLLLCTLDEATDRDSVLNSIDEIELDVSRGINCFRKRIGANFILRFGHTRVTRIALLLINCEEYQQMRKNKLKAEEVTNYDITRGLPLLE